RERLLPFETQTPNELCGDTANEGVRSDILDDHCARRHNSAGPHGHTRKDDNARAEPDPIANPNRSKEVLAASLVGRTDLMTDRQQLNVVPQVHSIADFDRRSQVDMNMSGNDR